MSGACNRRLVSSAGVNHLGAMNAHITALVDAQHQAGSCTAPRLSGGHAELGIGASMCGVSGFAFQGTNAHALLQVLFEGCARQYHIIVPFHEFSEVQDGKHVYGSLPVDKCYVRIYK